MTKEQELIKRDLQQAEYIGEDGGMVVDARFTQLGAYRKMAKRWIEDCGQDDWDSFKEDSDFTPDSLGIGYFHLMTEADREEMGAEQECEWYVSIEKKSKYKVWCYWG
jgi:hypothetical protein